MSGLVVRPGDTLVIPMDGRTTSEQSRAVKDAFQAQFPAITIVVVSGMTGDAFVYRPGGAE